MSTSSQASPPPPPIGHDPAVALERFEAAHLALGDSLLDLELSPSYLMLTGNDVGETTAHRYQTAIQETVDLWPIHNAIGVALDQAREFCDQRGKVTELTEVLTNRVVAVADAAKIAATDRFSVSELMHLLRGHYDQIRDAVAEVDRLWLEHLPRLDAAHSTLARLAKEASALGLREPLIGRAQTKAAALRQLLLSDPMAISADAGAELDDAVSAAANQLSSARAGHDNLDEDLANSEAVLADLRHVRAHAITLRTQSEAKIINAVGLARAPSSAVIDGPTGLAAQLDTILDATAPWTQRRALLDQWLARVSRLSTQLERVEAANGAPLQTRDELRGRLRAYRAKMAAVGRAEDLELMAIADQARTALFTAPTDLDDAQRIIDELAQGLRS